MRSPSTTGSHSVCGCTLGSVDDATVDHADPSMSIGFALYDGRCGPTPEETRVMANIDALASMIALTMTRCMQIRSKVFPNSRSDADAQSLADSMDLFISRQSRGATRYCNAKIVPQTEKRVNNIFHTYFWSPNGQSVPLDVVLGYRNFRIKPFVEVEEVFVSKAVRSIQLRLRECIVIPPLDRVSTRFSVCFPDRVCSTDAAADATATATVAAVDETPNKRKHEDENPEEEEEDALKRPKPNEELKQTAAASEDDSNDDSTEAPEEDNEGEEDP